MMTNEIIGGSSNAMKEIRRRNAWDARWAKKNGHFDIAATMTAAAAAAAAAAAIEIT